MANPFKIAFDGTYVWATLPFHASISRYNVNNGSQKSNLPVGQSPLGLAFDGTCMWARCMMRMW
jgi:DNA-binding beta-propeller fold protein YncE